MNTRQLKKKLQQKICLVLCIGVALTGLPIRYAEASFSSITSDSIKQKEAEIKKAEEQKKQPQSSVTDLKNILKELETSKKNLANYVKELDGQLNTINEKLEELGRLIEEKNEEIAKTQAELEEAQRIEQEQYEAMKKRIKFMYERGDNFLVEMVLSAQSFSELLNKADYVSMLSAYDRKMLEEYQATREAIEEIKAALEADRAVLKEAEDASQKEQDAMETLISEKGTEIKKFESDISNKEAIKKELEAELAAQTAEIEALEAAVAAERRRIAEANGLLPKYDGGKFAWPAPSYKRISDDYGNRTHPILGIQQFHNGVDMAAPMGSPILAAYDGKVVQASYSTTMGNYIMIDHGDSIYTIYMHASALHVSTGATVTRGQKIASVGSTGRSTGPHLHFSVRKNGSYVSPWNYLG